MSLPPLLLLEPSPRCSHKFIDSAVCLRCGEHCSDLHLADLGLDGEAISVERARQALRFVARFGEPLTDAGRSRLAQLRELLGRAWSQATRYDDPAAPPLPGPMGKGGAS